VYVPQPLHVLAPHLTRKRARGLKHAEIAAAKRAGFKRLLTESEERNEPMRRLNEKLGFVPAPEWSTLVIRGPLAILGM
jgi:GNAT superfamily N-acetyltransferase